ncbi:MAG: hypothetical protein GF416_04160 [Candidatus Altiarchaeales archaeon]|nr:hypothetical protein [Candidatus Altiarchaeales archaeon]MBD3416314.1 hypothetical protein [Candidatus Altiarchaeales archaeon]
MKYVGGRQGDVLQQQVSGVLKYIGQTMMPSIAGMDPSCDALRERQEPAQVEAVRGWLAESPDTTRQLMRECISADDGIRPDAYHVLSAMTLVFKACCAQAKKAGGNPGEMFSHAMEGSLTMQDMPPLIDGMGIPERDKPILRQMIWQASRVHENHATLVRDEQPHPPGGMTGQKAPAAGPPAQAGEASGGAAQSGAAGGGPAQGGAAETQIDFQPVEELQPGRDELPPTLYAVPQHSLNRLQHSEIPLGEGELARTFRFQQEGGRPRLITAPLRDHLAAAVPHGGTRALLEVVRRECQYFSQRRPKVSAESLYRQGMRGLIADPQHGEDVKRTVDQMSTSCYLTGRASAPLFLPPDTNRWLAEAERGNDYPTLFRAVVESHGLTDNPASRLTHLIIALGRVAEQRAAQTNQPLSEELRARIEPAYQTPELKNRVAVSLERAAKLGGVFRAVAEDILPPGTIQE